MTNALARAASVLAAALLVSGVNAQDPALDWIGTFVAA